MIMKFIFDYLNIWVEHFFVFLQPKNKADKKTIAMGLANSVQDIILRLWLKFDSPLYLVVIHIYT